jgi:hypothetical protein
VAIELATKLLRIFSLQTCPQIAERWRIQRLGRASRIEIVASDEIRQIQQILDWPLIDWQFPQA